MASNGVVESDFRVYLSAAAAKSLQSCLILVKSESHSVMFDPL